VSWSDGDRPVAATGERRYVGSIASAAITGDVFKGR
jgi:hypothetical protein